MIPAKNWVYIKFDKSNQDPFGNIIRKSGLVLPTAKGIAGRFKSDKNGTEGEDHRVSSKTTGTVVAFSGLNYREYDSVHESDLDFDTEEELHVGDFVIFDYKEHLQAEQDGRLIDETGYYNSDFAIIHYSKIFVRIRNGEVQPINGYLLIEPLFDEPTSKLEVIRKVSETKGIVRYAGTPVKYRQALYYEPDSEFCTVMPKSLKEPLRVKMPEVGDTVCFKDYNSKELQHVIHQTLPVRYYILQRRDVFLVM